MKPSHAEERAAGWPPRGRSPAPAPSRIDPQGVAQGLGLGHHGRALGVPDDAVDDVEGEDQPDLLPPPQAPPGARRPGRPSGRRRRPPGPAAVGSGCVRGPIGPAAWAGSRHRSERARAPTANAGAPRRLTTRFIPYSSRPRATAWPGGHPEGGQQQHEGALPQPEAVHRHGRTWAMATIGHERHGRRPAHVEAEGVARGPGRQHDGELVGEGGDQHRRGLARVAAHAVEPEVDGAQEAEPVGVPGQAGPQAGVAGHQQDHDQRRPGCPATGPGPGGWRCPGGAGWGCRRGRRG